MSIPHHKVAELAAQNDEFRRQLGTIGMLISRQGRYVITQGIDNLPTDTKFEIFEKVRTFDEFNKDNDPFGDHYFGAFDQGQWGKIFWQIDCYDPEYQFGSEDPLDPEKTRRVLTVMLAGEY